MLTVCLKSQVSGNKICFTQSEVNYFINQDLIAKSLIIDTTLMGVKNRQCDSINDLNNKNIAYFRANEIDLKSINKKKDVVIGNYKMDIIKLNDKYENKVKWNKIYKKTIFGLFVLTLMESTILYFKLK